MRCPSFVGTTKDPRGQRPYHPAMMVTLRVYAYCTRVYSSRRVERACIKRSIENA